MTKTSELAGRSLHERSGIQFYELCNAHLVYVRAFGDFFLGLGSTFMPGHKVSRRTAPSPCHVDRMGDSPFFASGDSFVPSDNSWLVDWPGFDRVVTRSGTV